jgi:cytochrome c-type biogenesis protein CcmH
VSNRARDLPPAGALLRVIAAVMTAGAVAAADRVPGSGTSADARAVLCEVEPPRETAVLEQCVQRSPRDVESLLDLASAREAAGQLSAAVHLYRRAVAVDPLDAAARMTLARALLASGQREAARAEAARAASLRPGDPEARHLAALPLDAGRP